MNRPQIDMTPEVMANPRAALHNGDLQSQASAIAEMVRGGRGASSIAGDDPSPPTNFRNEEAPVDRGTPDRLSGAKPAGGRGDLARALTENPPFEGAAEVFKETQRVASTQANEMREMRENLARMEGLLTGKGIVPEEAVAPVDAAAQARQELLGRANPQTHALLEAYLTENGFIRESDVEAKEQEATLSQRAEMDLRKATETYGADFGELDEEGNFKGWNAEVAPVVNDVLERLVDPERGASPQDLYRLARHDDLIEQAYQKGAEESRAGTARVRKVSQFPVANGSTPAVNSSPKIYTKGDDHDDVLDRALVVSINKMRAAGHNI